MHCGISGTDLQDLKTSVRQRNIQVAYLIPTVHNPTGSCSITSRERIAAIARRYDILLIEEAT